MPIREAYTVFAPGDGLARSRSHNFHPSSIKGVATGKRKTMYGSIFYHLDGQTEFYLAADHLTTTGTYKAAQANGFMSQSEFGLGMRYKF